MLKKLSNKKNRRFAKKSLKVAQNREQASEQSKQKQTKQHPIQTKVNMQANQGKAQASPAQALPRESRKSSK